MYLRFFQRLFSRKNKKFSLGVTLVELAVSIGIFAILTAVIVINYSDFNSNLVMTNLSYEIGLFVRQAQVYGTAVLGQKGKGFETGNFDDLYGVVFDLGNPKEVLMFIDVNSDQKYLGDGSCDSSGDEECIEKILMSRGVEISEICVSGNSGDNCLNEGGIMYVMFKRPDPSAIIKISEDGEVYNSAVVTLKSPQGRERSISITPSGQISIRNNQDVQE